MSHMMNWQQLLTETRYNTNNIFYIRPESAYNMDAVKIIKTQEFQQLAEKTHRFPIGAWGLSRTSMTHSLEVAQIAKMIVHKFGKGYIGKSVSENQISQMTLIVNAAALLREIGIPGFGYAGERGIRQWFKENLSELTVEDRKVVDVLSKEQRYDLEHLNAQSQSFRIVSRMHDETWHVKMNLTYPILNTILPYPTDYLKGNKPHHFGYYQSDLRFYQQVVQKTGALTGPHPLALILEASADIVSTISTIKEAVEKDLVSGVEMLNYLQGFVDEQDISYGQLYQAREFLGWKGQEISRRIQEESVFLLWMEELQLCLVDTAAASFRRNYTQIMMGSCRQDLFYETDIEPLMRGLQAFEAERVLKHPELSTSELVGSKIMAGLLAEFVPEVLKFDRSKLGVKEASFMSLFNQTKEGYYKELAKIPNMTEGDRLYHLLLRVVDGLSELTDEAALTLYKKRVGDKIRSH